MEVAKAFGDEGAIWMTGVLNEAMREGIPEECSQAQYHIYISSYTERRFPGM